MIDPAFGRFGRQVGRLIVVGLLAVGCAASDGTWREVATPHFLLRTDFDAKTALQAAAALEATRDALISAAWPDVQIPEWTRAEVYVLADDTQFKNLFGSYTIGYVIGGPSAVYFLSGPPGRWEVRRTLREETTSLLRFQMAFDLAGVQYPGAPRWFRHGLAHFLDTIHPSEDGRSLVMGAANSEKFRSYRSYRSISVAQALSWKTIELPQPKRDGLDGVSWLLVHWLLNTHAEQFARYRAELHSGTEAARAFAVAFPDFDPEATDRALFKYSKSGTYSEVSVPLRSTRPALEQRPLDPADLHVLEAKLAMASAEYHGRPGANDVSRAEIRKALALDPTKVEALEQERDATPEDRLPRVRKAAEAHPENGRAWQLLARVLSAAGKQATGEYESVLHKALALSPDNPDLLNDLAWSLLEQGRAQAAVPLAFKAMRRAPHEPNVLDTYAAALFALGNCSGVVEAQQRAVDLEAANLVSTDPSAIERLGRLKKRLTSYKTRCEGPARRP